jgi:hypothetical protein
MKDSKTGGQGKVKKIREQAIQILEQCPDGVRFAELCHRIKVALPAANEGTISNVVYDLPKTYESVFKPARGLFRHAKYGEAVEPKRPTKLKFNESDFYKPFADWLVKVLEECTRAIPVGGNIFRDKWGTPDVIGIRESKRGDIIKLPAEIVSAEIKLDPANLITAFGQACAYRLFSHKSYIVVPENSAEEDIARLDALSRILGVGLILFCPDDPGDAGFSIRARAVKHDPDMFYVNRCMKIIAEDLF